MLKIIKAELYKVFNRPFLYVFFGFTALVMAGFNVLINSLSTKPMTVHELLTISTNFLTVPVYLVLVIISICTNEELKEKTLRNTLSFGISRNRLYIAKFAASVIISVIAAAMVLVAFLGSAFLLFKPGDGLTSAFMGGFFLRILSAIPMYMASLSIGALLGFAIKNETVYAFTYAGLFVATEPILKGLCYFVSNKLAIVYNLLITVQLSNIGRADTTDVMSAAVILGFVYTIIFTAAGMIMFRRQEIK